MSEHDPSLFKGTAYYYARYRRGYPAAFFAHLIHSFQLSDSSRVLDLGTGTGQIAIPLASQTREVVALDPDEEMLAEGKKLAQGNNGTNIRWIKATAEDLTADLGTFDLTTMGASFHWMDQDTVLKKVYAITNNNGGIAIVANTTSIYRNQNNDAWKTVVRTVIESYLGKRRRAGKNYFKEPQDRFEDIVERSLFTNLEKFHLTYTQEWTIDQILGFLSSTSFAARRLFGENLQSFETTLRDELLKLNKNGIFTEENSLEALLAWKKQ